MVGVSSLGLTGIAFTDFRRQLPCLLLFDPST